MEEEGSSVQIVSTRHDIGLVTASRLVAIFWAGLVPVVFPAWLIIKSEVAAQNADQDRSIARAYVTRQEFEERMKLLDERSIRNFETLKEIREDMRAQRDLIERMSQRARH